MSRMSALAVESPAAVTEDRRGAAARRFSETLSATVVLSMALWLGLRPFKEVDLWWHLRVGANIRETGQLLGPDPWAAFAARPYMATQWLPEVTASWAYDNLGMGAILWLRTAAVIAVAALVYRTCRAGASAAGAAVVTTLCLLASTASLNPRPQLLSFVFFAVTVAAWRSTAKDHKPRWWLIAVYWLWACSHGLWMFGLMVGGVTLVAMVVQQHGKPPSRRDAGRMALLLALSAAAVAVTPLGPALWTAPFKVAGNASWIADEWQRTPLGNAASIVGILLLLLAGVQLLRRRLALWEVAQLGLAIGMFLWMWRLVPLAVILAAPMAAATLGGQPPAPSGAAPRRGPRVLAVGVGAALLAAGAVAAGPRAESASRYPRDMTAVDSVLSCHLKREVVFNDFGLSGWLLWRHPHLSPYADLRVEIYSREHLEGYQVAEKVATGWETVVRESGATLALLRPDAPLATTLIDRGWETLARSEGGVLLAPRGTQDQTRCASGEQS